MKVFCHEVILDIVDIFTKFYNPKSHIRPIKLGPNMTSKKLVEQEYTNIQPPPLAIPPIKGIASALLVTFRDCQEITKV